MSVAIVALILICLINLTLGSVIFSRNPKLRANVSFLLMSIAISFWVVTNYLTDGNFHSLVYNSLFNRLAFAGGYLVVLCGLLFSYNFPLHVRISKLEKRGIIIASLVALGLSLTSYGAGNVTKVDGTLHFSTGPLIIGYIAAFIFCLGLIARNFSSHLHKTSPLVRHQARLVSSGFVVTALLGITLNLILPIFGLSWSLTQYGPFATILLVALISYAMIKHGLFDIRLVIARSVAYISSIIVLSSIFGFLVFGVLSLIFGLTIPFVAQLFISIATSFAALGFARLKKFFDRVTNQLFYADAYDPQSLFDGLNATLVLSNGLNELLQSVTTLLGNELKSQFCLIDIKGIVGRTSRVIGTQKRTISDDDAEALGKLTARYRRAVIATDYLNQPSEQHLKSILVHNDIAVLVRLSPKMGRSEEGLGYLIFGPKKSGNPYNSEDFRVLDTVAKELVIAIQNALHFEEIQNFNQTLQDKVQQATKEMRRSNEKLKALDETKDDFVSMASHQLRTPLTSVKGYLSLVLDGDAGPISDSQKQLLNQAFISSQRMVYLISDLLNVSRLKNGKFIIQPSSVNLAEVVADEIEQLKETAASRSISMAYDKPADFPDLQLDDTKIRQVVMNFMDNAIYYTPSGGVMTIKLTDRNGLVELRIIDNGIGVPKSEQYHLFTKFYRAENARQARPDGTGLGLFMAKKVITAQGGTLIFESKEGKGSTFGFTFNKAKLSTSPPQ